MNFTQARQGAQAKLPQAIFNHYDGAVEDETTLAENRAALGRIKLVQRVLRDVSDCDVTTTVLGERVSLPVLLAPAGHHGLADPQGELATARAASAAGTVMMLSNGSTFPLEEVRAAGDGPQWFQLFLLTDRGLTRDLAARAESAGFTALVVTVDTQALGNFERNAVLGREFILGMREGNLERYGDRFRSLIELFDPSATWDSLSWLRGCTALPIVVKGIQTAADAATAAEVGADAVYVSNHGGRQLDAGAGTVDLLPGVVHEVGDRVEVLVDGGFRRGTDVVKALALGARAVVIGRPYLFGLASGGEAGVRDVVETLRAELIRNLKLMGCRRLDELDASWLRVPAAAARGDGRQVTTAGR